MIYQAIYSILTNDADLQASGVDISPIIEDRSRKVPFAVYMLEDDYQYGKLQGRHVVSELTFMVASDSYVELNDITSLLNSALDSFEGTSEGVRIGSIDIISGEDSRDDESRLFVKTVLFKVVWEDE